MRNGKVAVIAGIVLVVVLGAAILFQNQQYQSLALDREEEKIRIIEEADRLALGYYYDEAVSLLQHNPELYDQMATDDAITLKIAEIQEKKNALVKYQGPIEHVFFHSLIIYPKLAFDDRGHPAQGYNMWMTTVKEFKAMLPNFYARGYVLYPLSEYIEKDPENPEKIRLKDIYLPPGKIPLVISIDDVNYYDYMKPDGFANRLVLGKDGRVWTEVITPGGETILTRDGDVMPILDDFTAQHPDFSFRGAKGVIAVTGYQGALGYRITDDLPEEAQWQQEVKAIADTLKADGWLFACHSYTHNSYFRTGKVTMEQMVYDTDRWKQKIEPWIGPTNIYISAFGWNYFNQNPIHRYIPDSGFEIFCPVGNGRSLKAYDDIAVMPRVNLDGYMMNQRPGEAAEHYFNVDEVIDPARPPLVL